MMVYQALGGWHQFIPEATYADCIHREWIEGKKREMHVTQTCSLRVITFSR